MVLKRKKYKFFGNFNVQHLINKNLFCAEVWHPLPVTLSNLQTIIGEQVGVLQGQFKEAGPRNCSIKKPFLLKR